ncbi:HAD superfamily hydrolase [Phage vB_KsaM-C1]|nr:HAD superfamily hydrolase [Phage vB_KsaM-C1]
MKTIISHHKLSEMVKSMTEVQALTTLSRMRADADREGLCVTRLIVGGKVREQWLWKR